MVRPVHQATKIVPFIHAAKLDAIPHAQRHTLCKINIVRNQQRVPVGELYDKALMARIVVIVGQQTNDAT